MDDLEEEFDPDLLLRDISMNETNETSIDSFCFDSIDYENFELLETLRFLLGGMIELPTVIIGILINLFFASVLLSRTNLRLILFNQMMIANSFINIATLLLTLLYLPVEIFSLEHVNEAFFLHFVYPLTFVGISASSFMMAALAHERSTAVASKNAGSCCNLTRYLSLVLVPALIVNLPKFFEYTWDKDVEDVYAILPADFKLDHNYIRYYKYWAGLLIKKIVPNTILLFYSFKIYKKIKLTFAETGRQVDPILAHELGISRLFLKIVGFFFISRFISICISINEAIHIEEKIICEEHGRLWHTMGELCFLFISFTLNTFFMSCSLLILLLSRSGYRQHCVEFWKCRVHTSSDPVEEEGLVEASAEMATTEIDVVLSSQSDAPIIMMSHSDASRMPSQSDLPRSMTSQQNASSNDRNSSNYFTLD